jgi:hypothetical protein
VELFADGNNVVTLILLVAGGGLGGFFGPRLGDLIVLLATSVAGSYLIVYGLTVLFESRFDSELDDPSANMGQRLTLTLFLILVVLSGAAQWNYMRLRQRFLR